MRRAAGIALLAVLLLVPRCPARDLLSYVQKPDDSFKWEKVSEKDSIFGRIYILNMRSQTWQGIPWTHEIEIVKPGKCDCPQTAFLFVTFGKPGEEQSKVISALAESMGCPIAILYGIPNQPLFDGRREDALIAYTFVKALETGDTTWPLLLPMAKAAVRAMDAIQEFSEYELKSKITGFVVSGGSKRGWTTWLAAAVDPVRVKGIVPIVYDNLNLAAQMPHQIATWGKYSDRIDDYTKLGIQQALATDEGKRLSTIVDPWAYRSRITMPKLIINGTNDPYWTQDALNLYWDDLAGPKFILYAPNVGHGVNDLVRVLSSASAFTRAVATGSPLPNLTWKHATSNGKHRLNISADPPSSGATLWVAKSDTRDFRQSKWESTPMTDTETGFTGTVELPKDGYVAAFGEVAVSPAGRSCTLSTQIEILDSKGPVRPKG